MRNFLLFVMLFATCVTEDVIAKGNADDGKTKAYTCSGCHGIPGYKNAYPNYKVPRLGGQNAQYMTNALAAYREGARAHPTMRLQAESLSDQDIADIVSNISSLQLHDSVLKDQTQGYVPEKVQLCETCHGADGRGIDDSTPVLAGQYSSYLERALLDYRSGDRNNAIMAGFAGALSDTEISELVAWYSSMEGLKDLSGK